MTALARLLGKPSRQAARSSSGVTSASGALSSVTQKAEQLKHRDIERRLQADKKKSDKEIKIILLGQSVGLRCVALQRPVAEQFVLMPSQVLGRVESQP
jgi:hypothetical protein